MTGGNYGPMVPVLIASMQRLRHHHRDDLHKTPKAWEMTHDHYSDLKREAILFPGILDREKKNAFNLPIRLVAVPQIRLVCVEDEDG